MKKRFLSDLWWLTMDRVEEKWADHSIRSTVNFGDDDHDNDAGDEEVDVDHNDDSSQLWCWCKRALGNAQKYIYIGTFFISNWSWHFKTLLSPSDLNTLNVSTLKMTRIDLNLRKTDLRAFSLPFLRKNFIFSIGVVDHLNGTPQREMNRYIKLESLGHEDLLKHLRSSIS